MRNTCSVVLVAFALGGYGVVAVADDTKLSLRVKVGDAAESRLTVVDGHKAELMSTELHLELVPTVSQDSVMLSMTVKDADKGVVGTPQLKSRFGHEMKLVLRSETKSPLTVLITPERIN